MRKEEILAVAFGTLLGWSITMTVLFISERNYNSHLMDKYEMMKDLVNDCRYIK